MTIEHLIAPDAPRVETVSSKAHPIRRALAPQVFTGDACERARAFLTMLPVRLGLRLVQVRDRTGIPDSTYSDLTCTMRRRPIAINVIERVAVACASELNLDVSALLHGIEEPAHVTDPVLLDWLFGQAFAPTLGGYAELWRAVAPLERGSRQIAIASMTLPCRFQTGAVARVLMARVSRDARRRAREFSRRWAFDADREGGPAVCAPLRLTTLERLLASSEPFAGLSPAAAERQFHLLANARDPDGGVAFPVLHDDSRALQPWRSLWRGTRQVILYDERIVLLQNAGGCWTLHAPTSPWQARLVAIHAHVMHTWTESADDQCGYDTFAALPKYAYPNGAAE